MLQLLLTVLLDYIDLLVENKLHSLNQSRITNQLTGLVDNQWSVIWLVGTVIVRCQVL